MVKYIILFVIFLLGFWYLVLPSYPSITTISSPLNAEVTTSMLRSSFADSRSLYTQSNKPKVIDYYKSQLQAQNCTVLKSINLFCYFQPFVITHSSSLSAFYLPTKQPSTYLVEIFYPLRNSLFINGYEPYDANGKPAVSNPIPLFFNNTNYFALISIFYYPSKAIDRVIIYIGIWVSSYLLVRFIKKVL